jgi:hypothetical protein
MNFNLEDRIQAGPEGVSGMTSDNPAFFSVPSWANRPNFLTFGAALAFQTERHGQDLCNPHILIGLLPFTD